MIYRILINTIHFLHKISVKCVLTSFLQSASIDDRIDSILLVHSKSRCRANASHKYLITKSQLSKTSHSKSSEMIKIILSDNAD